MTIVTDDRSGGTFAVVELVAEVSGRAGRKPRWTELRLWTAKEGGYVVQKLGVSRVIDERQRRTAWHCGDVAAITKTIGTGPLSRLLLRAAGIDG